MYRYGENRFYKKEGGNYAEFIFFVALALSIYLKFYFLELAVSSSATRYWVSALSSLGVTLWLVLPVSLVWRRLRPYAAFLVDFLLTALVVTDVLYMRYYSDLFTFGNIGLSAQVGEISESVAALFHTADLLYFIDFPILLLFLFIAGRRGSGKLFARLSIKRIAAVFLLLLCGGSLFFWRVLSYQRLVPGVLRSMWDRPAVCNNVGAMTYHVVDAWNCAADRLLKDNLPDGAVDEIAAWFDGRKSSGVSEAKTFGAAKGKNLIIIQVESLQHFVVDLKVNGAEVTPNINKFAREAAYFSGVYNQTGSGNSSDAEFLANTGLYPSASGVAYTRFAGNRYYALPKLLTQNGYAALALHGDRPGFWNRRRMYPSMGFQRFVSKNDFILDENIGMGLSDKSFFRQSLEILEKEPKPFYAFLITLTSHYPYNFKQIGEQTKLDVGEFEGRLMGNYLTSMRYFDDQFGTFLAGLKKSGLLDSSVIVVYGDHTAIPAWDKASLARLLGRELGGAAAWREVLKIPLMIKIPGKKQPKGEYASPAGLVDVPETAAALLGFRFASGFGRDLFGERRDEPVIFRNGSYIIGNVFVEPSAKRAVDLKSGLAAVYDDYGKMTEEVGRRLRYNDMILEHDLIPELIKE